MNQYRYIDSVIYWNILNTIGVAYTGHVMRPPHGKNEMTEKKGESKWYKRLRAINSYFTYF